MRTAPISHSSQHATGPGADPVRDLREGQLTDRSGAQVRDTPAESDARFCSIYITKVWRCFFVFWDVSFLRLCSLEGMTVSSAGELETGHCYVAVGTERFKKLPYEALLASKERHFKSVILLTRYMHVSLTS